MNNKILTQSLSAFRIILISSLTIFTLYTVQAWVSPTVSAPNGNVGGPLTTATSTQIKTGSLGLLDNLSIGKDLIVNGTTTTNVLKIITGAGANKILTSDASGNASWASSTDSGVSQSLGFGQTWQNMNGSSVGCAGVRAQGVVCTNSTGKPIQVSVSMANTVGTFAAVATVGGVKFLGSGATTASYNSYINFVVPPGSTYSVTTNNNPGSAYIGGDATVAGWAELR